MVLRLSIAVGCTPESWLVMQDNDDLWQIRQTTSFDNVCKVEFTT